MWGAEDDFAFEAAYGGGGADASELDSCSLACFRERPKLRRVSRAELARHGTPEDCWVAIHGCVYDLTAFAKGHVGGAELVTRLAGTDGTDSFARKHGRNVLNSLAGTDCVVGELSELAGDDLSEPPALAAEAPAGDAHPAPPPRPADGGGDAAAPAAEEPLAHTEPPAKRLRAAGQEARQRAVVIGGGLAGMAAANTVVECGGSVLVLEKSAFCGGNSTKATSGISGAGTQAQRAHAVEDSPELFLADALAGGARRPELAEALCRRSGDAVAWLTDRFGVDLSCVGQLGGHSRARTHRGRERFPGMTITYALIKALEEVAQRGDRAIILTRARATRLLLEPDGACGGCCYEHAGVEHEMRGPVVIATGGFAADFREDSLLARHRPDLMHLPTTNSQQSTGDGIKIAEQIGARTLDLEWVQVHPTGLVDPSDVDAKGKSLAAEVLRGAGGLLLDAGGSRFVNELGRRDDVTREMGKRPAPFRLLLNAAAAQEVEWHCRHYASRGLMKLFPSGRELCEAVGWPLQSLEATHEEHFQAAKSTAEDPDGGPWPGYPGGRSWDAASGPSGAGKRFFRHALRGGQVADEPFYVAVVTPVLHYCMGGLETDAGGAALGADGQPIAGLWVAGEAAGGVHGSNRLGGNSLLDCVVFGRLAGQACARRLPRGSPPAAAVAPGAAAPGAAVGATPAPAAAGPPAADAVFTLEEVARHCHRTDCWLIVHGRVLDVTGFLEEHPGGALPLMAYAGKDASEDFDLVHPPGVIDRYARSTVIGRVGAQEPQSPRAPSKAGRSTLPAISCCPCCRCSLEGGARGDDEALRASCAACGVEVTIRRPKNP